MGEPLPGTPYRLLVLLGEGAHGTVWVAEHVELGVRVVVKVIHPRLTARSDVAVRMRREARILARCGADFSRGFSGGFCWGGAPTASGMGTLSVAGAWNNSGRLESSGRYSLPTLTFGPATCVWGSMPPGKLPRCSDVGVASSL